MTADTVHPAWRVYRKWRRVLWGMLLAFLPAVMLVDRVARAEVVITFAIAWMASTFLCLIPRNTFRCPRCSELFHVWTMRGAYGLRFNVSNMISRKCVHCELRRYANP